jgi:hypothetical protein
MSHSARLAIAVVLLTVPLTLAGCTDQTVSANPPANALDPLAPEPGSTCTVHFRRDTLGAAADNAIPVTSGSHNGATVVLNGVIVNMNDDWLVLTSVEDDTQRWIPRSVILYLDVRAK